MQQRGVEFVFAQFVDMYARPSAKLVPVGSREAFDGLARGGRRLRRLRRRRDRTGPERPRHRRDPRPRELHARPLAAEPRALRVRRHGRGRGVAVLPADDPSPRARPRRGEGLRVQDGARARVLPRQAARGRLDRDRRPVRHAREALLRHGRAHAALRLPDHGLALLQRPRLGQLRERPRGRERPVRAELHVRERAHELRPRDLLPLHGAHARRAERDDRDLHAEAVQRPDRQRLPLPHVALGRRHEPLPRRVRPARARPLRARLQLHRRPEGRTRARRAR